MPGTSCAAATTAPRAPHPTHTEADGGRQDITGGWGLCHKERLPGTPSCQAQVQAQVPVQVPLQVQVQERAPSKLQQPGTNRSPLGVTAARGRGGTTCYSQQPSQRRGPRLRRRTSPVLGPIAALRRSSEPPPWEGRGPAAQLWVTGAPGAHKASLGPCSTWCPRTSCTQQAARGPRHGWEQPQIHEAPLTHPGNPGSILRPRCSPPRRRNKPRADPWPVACLLRGLKHSGQGQCKRARGTRATPGWRGLTCDLLFHLLPWGHKSSPHMEPRQANMGSRGISRFVSSLSLCLRRSERVLRILPPPFPILCADSCTPQTSAPCCGSTVGRGNRPRGLGATSQPRPRMAGTGRSGRAARRRRPQGINDPAPSKRPRIVRPPHAHAGACACGLTSDDGALPHARGPRQDSAGSHPSDRPWPRCVPERQPLQSAATFREDTTTGRLCGCTSGCSVVPASNGHSKGRPKMCRTTDAPQNGLPIASTNSSFMSRWQIFGFFAGKSFLSWLHG